MPDTPDDLTREQLSRRIADHVASGWPAVHKPVVHHRGQYSYVAAVLPGGTNPIPLLRLEYQGSPDTWGIALYDRDDDRYSPAELPSSFGEPTGTPEQALDVVLPAYTGQH